MIKPYEIKISGRWILKEGKMVGDKSCLRIENLVANYLLELGSDLSGWDILYLDKNDGRLWELIYPQGEMHGGGPPELRCLNQRTAKEKYSTLVYWNQI